MQITPAILTDAFLEVQRSLEIIRYCSGVETVHIDVIDGQFADNVTVAPLDLTVADFDPLKIDFHLMTDEPMDYVYECEALKGYLPIRRMIGQVERMSHQQDFVWSVKANGWEASLALNLFTPLDAIEKEVWPELDHILLLGVEAGQQGQVLHNHLFEKLHEISEMNLTRKLSVSVDGGVKLNTAPAILKYAVDELVVGSGIWHSDDPVQAIEEFNKVVGEA